MTKRNIVNVVNIFVIIGRRIFDKWLENGIHKSKITLLFWSKAFKQDELCLYQSENAVLRASLTKGRHIVISVVIDNCKIPERYKQFGCVYAWLWRENPPKALQNVLQSVRGMLTVPHPYMRMLNNYICYMTGENPFF